jgi:hypothetical protein
MPATLASGHTSLIQDDALSLALGEDINERLGRRAGAPVMSAPARPGAAQRDRLSGSIPKDH